MQKYILKVRIPTIIREKTFTPSTYFILIAHLVNCFPPLVDLQQIISQRKRTPTQKYDKPVTSSQEIGWFSTPLVRF